MKRFALWIVLVSLCLVICGCGANNHGQNPNGTIAQVPGVNDVDTGKEYSEVIEAYVNSGDYSGAIQYYNSLSSSVQSQSSVAAAYINALSSYKTDVIRNVEQYIASGDFTAARSLLTVASNQIGNDATLSAKLKEVNEQELLQTVQIYEASCNYAAAITYLNQNQSIVSSSMELQIKLETHKELYRNAVITQAADAYESGGVDVAMSVLIDALKILPNDDALIAEKERYEKAVPVPLKDLDPLQQGDYIFVGTRKYKVEYAIYSSQLKKNIDKVSMDVNGNVYDSDNVYFAACLFRPEDGNQYMSITYFLNMEYNILTGVLYRPYVTQYCTIDWTSDGAVEIYGDGALLYKGTISQDSFDTVSISVNITGVRELRIILSGLWKDPEWGINDYCPKVCLTDLEVSKEP